MKNRYIQIFSCLIALLSFATFPACELDDEINFVKGVTISVTTNPISNIGSTYAVAGGVVKATNNNTLITGRGVVYSSSPNPTIESDINVSGGSGLGSFWCNLVDLLDETKYYVRAYAINAYGKVLYGEEVSFTTKVQAMPEYVDLGLSVKWATFNVGASTPEEYGDYFAWGETEPKATYYWSTYKWCNDSVTTLTKYNTDSSYGTVDNKTQLDLSDDAAHVNWGGDWRMPTEAEWTELREQCTWTRTTQNGVKGYKVTSKKVSYSKNSIFLPAAGCRYDSDLSYAGSVGYYWSSSLKAGNPDNACDMYLDSSDVLYVFMYFGYRSCGRSVRPVCP